MRIRMIRKLGLIALLLIALFPIAYSDDPPPPPPPPGLEPGNRPFTNPFANSGDSPDEVYDEEDGEGFSGGNPGGGAPGDSGLSFGGQPIGGEGSKSSIAAIRISDETGEGSKEIVTDFNFPDADIMDIAKTLGKLTGKNFILDKNVKGRITIISNSPITVGDAWKAFLTALDINGFTIIPSGKYLRIARQRDARDKQVRTYTGSASPNTDALITRIFQLKYIGADEVARTFRSFMPPTSRIIPHDQTNTVIVTDTGSNIDKLAKMLDILDVEGFDAGIDVLPVQFASAAELAKLLDQLLPGSPAAGGVRRPNAPRTGGAGFTSRRTKEGGIINAVIADDRTNSLIVHANSKGVEQVRDLVKKLDQKVAVQAAGGRVHVIYLQFADAEQVANVINGLGSSGSKSAAPTAGARPGGTGANPVAAEASLFESSIRVSADKSTNSLVITASPSDFATLQRVIAKLDIPRDEVYVEAVIMEMGMENNFNWSANVAFPNKGIGFLPGGDLAGFLQSPLAAKGLVLGMAGGDEVTTKINGQDFKVRSIQGLVKALQTNASANILATPQIMTLDNTEAEFESAEMIPTPTTTTSGNGVVSAGVTKEKVSLSLKIKPQINKLSNFVKLEIKAKLADFSGRELPSQVAQQALATIERNANTNVVVADGDTVVLGGLVRDSQAKIVSKVPLLGDIPVLGWLFRKADYSNRKSNLLIFITPHIVRQYEKTRAILDRKLKERDQFIEKELGSEDTMRGERDRMVRSLPDLNKLLSQKAKTEFTINPNDTSAGSLSTPEKPEKKDGNATDANATLPPNYPPQPQPMEYPDGLDEPPPTLGGGDLPPPPPFEGE